MTAHHHGHRGTAPAASRAALAVLLLATSSSLAQTYTIPKKGYWRQGGTNLGMFTAATAYPASRRVEITWLWTSTNNNGAAEYKIYWQLYPSQYIIEHWQSTESTGTKRPHQIGPAKTSVVVPASGRYRLEWYWADGNVHLYVVEFYVDWEAMLGPAYDRGYHFDSESSQNVLDPGLYDSYLDAWYDRSDDTHIKLLLNASVFQPADLQYVTSAPIPARYRVNGGGWTTIIAPTLPNGVWSALAQPIIVDAPPPSTTSTYDIEIGKPAGAYYRRWTFTLEGDTYDGQPDSEIPEWQPDTGPDTPEPDPDPDAGGGGVDDQQVGGWFTPSQAAIENFLNALASLKTVPPFGPLWDTVETLDQGTDPGSWWGSPTWRPPGDPLDPWGEPIVLSTIGSPTAGYAMSEFDPGQALVMPADPDVEGPGTWNMSPPGRTRATLVEWRAWLRAILQVAWWSMVAVAVIGYVRGSNTH